MSEAELDPHWAAIEQELGIHITEERLLNENNRLVRAGCNALGIGPRDMITILQAIKAAGALQADIEAL